MIRIGKNDQSLIKISKLTVMIPERIIARLHIRKEFKDEGFIAGII